MGAKYKPKDYEVLRRRCVALWQDGLKQKAIAAALGITQGGVSRTLTKFKQQGEAALQYRKPTGAPPRLTQEQVAQLVEELSKGPQHHGFAGEVWTRKRVKAVIEQLFEVSYDVSQVGRILKKVGWTGTPGRSAEASKEGPPTKARSRARVARRAPTGTKKKRSRRTG
ncbi:hypothetical protein GCM10023189_28900 [Nibrella saemangeumensis]|uniref:Transposase n=1 Tax=Nibrella saemangeumensis TaxID=1084526 RepID=A0ABP8MXC0_9BACT